MIGQQLSPVLEEIEATLWEFEAEIGAKPNFTNEGFRAATKIFIAALMDRVWDLQVSEKITMEDREKMVMSLAKEVRTMVKTYADIDTHDLYKN